MTEDPRRVVRDHARCLHALPGHGMTDDILAAAQARAAARMAADAARPRIDYARMQRTFPKQKAALTRALNKIKATKPERPWEDGSDEHEAAKRKLVEVCAKTVQEWNEIGAWPDDWSIFQRGLDDGLGWPNHVRLEDL